MADGPACDTSYFPFDELIENLTICLSRVGRAAAGPDLLRAILRGRGARTDLFINGIQFRFVNLLHLHKFCEVVGVYLPSGGRSRG